MCPMDTWHCRHTSWIASSTLTLLPSLNERGEDLASAAKSYAAQECAWIAWRIWHLLSKGNAQPWIGYFKMTDSSVDVWKRQEAYFSLSGHSWTHFGLITTETEHGNSERRKVAIILSISQDLHLLLQISVYLDHCIITGITHSLSPWTMLSHARDASLEW